MHVTLVHVWVKNNHIQEFIDATIKNHIESVKEPGNLRFDLLNDTKDPCKFIIYEAFESDEAAAFHKTTNHYKEWREKVAPFMEKQREGIKYSVVYPTHREAW